MDKENTNILDMREEALNNENSYGEKNEIVRSV